MPVTSKAQRRLHVSLEIEKVSSSQGIAARQKTVLSLRIKGLRSIAVLSDVPSWCTDYTSMQSEPFDSLMVKYPSGQDSRIRLGEERKRWNTTGDSRVPTLKVATDLTQGLLRVKGLQIGRILGSGMSQHRDAADAISARNLIQMLLIYDTPGQSHTEAVVMLNLIFNSREARHVQVLESSTFRTIKPWLERIENLVFSGTRVKHRLLRYGEAYIAAEKDIVVPDGEGDPSGNWQTPISSSDIEHIDSPADLAPALHAIMREELDLMEMDEPHICWAHPGAEFGDQVFLF
jgi:hypothetical protein